MWSSPSANWWTPAWLARLPDAAAGTVSGNEPGPTAGPLAEDGAAFRRGQRVVPRSQQACPVWCEAAAGSGGGRFAV